MVKGRRAGDDGKGRLTANNIFGMLTLLQNFPESEGVLRHETGIGKGVVSGCPGEEDLLGFIPGDFLCVGGLVGQGRIVEGDHEQGGCAGRYGDFAVKVEHFQAEGVEPFGQEGVPEEGLAAHPADQEVVGAEPGSKFIVAEGEHLASVEIEGAGKSGQIGSEAEAVTGEGHAQEYRIVVQCEVGGVNFHAQFAGFSEKIKAGGGRLGKEYAHPHRIDLRIKGCVQVEEKQSSQVMFSHLGRTNNSFC